MNIHQIIFIKPIDNPHFVCYNVNVIKRNTTPRIKEMEILIMTYITNRRINIRTIRNIAENDGLTLRNGKIVRYKTGWQVGITGIECRTPEEVTAILHSPMGRKGNIGIWLSEGIYYVDISKRITTKKNALTVAGATNQLSIYGWRPRKRGQLVWCE